MGTRLQAVAAGVRLDQRSVLVEDDQRGVAPGEVQCH
jgi:hypothetical protein